MSVMLTNFRSVAPAHVSAQEHSLEWLANAHAHAEGVKARDAGAPFDEVEFRERLLRLLIRVGCKPEQIATRGHELSDYCHSDWQEMEVFRVEQQPHGLGAAARTRFFDSVAFEAFERLFDRTLGPPRDLLHVTCTGYSSPSAAQRLVASRGWGARTRVTHAYHMGCYAAFPALRMAASFVESPAAAGTSTSERSEICHTEMCSLHMDPLAHSPEQLLVQSLFADGFIAYSIQARAGGAEPNSGLALVHAEESILPGSGDSMTWACADHGMAMSLARDVPDRIAAEVGEFVDALCERAGLSPNERSAALLAVHPGGPKILDRTRDALGADEGLLTFSRKVLRERGNMSSATLPHVWMEIARAEVGAGRPILSLAFGPGLTVCGAVMTTLGRA